MEECAKIELISLGTQRNRGFYEENVIFSTEIPDWKQWAIFDAQTSGGLMLSAPTQKAGKLLTRLHEEGIEKASIVGDVVDYPQGKIVVK